jgi:molybdopterin converting factor small subunit
VKIKLSVIGVPEMAEAREAAFMIDITAEKFLDMLQTTVTQVYRQKIRENFSLLINGRNVLSLPDKLQTKLQDGDEVILTVQVMGG